MEDDNFSQGEINDGIENDQRDGMADMMSRILNQRIDAVNVIFHFQ